MTADGLRIVSLLPSATEIAVALGLAGNIVGRSHECDYPPEIVALPVLTASKLTKGMNSAEIEIGVQQIVQQGLSVYEVDAPLLRMLRPDVILTQSQCAVCAVTPRDLEEALAAWVGNPPLLVSLAPDDLSDVWGDVQRVADAAGVPERAASVVATLNERMDAIGRHRPASATRPTVAAIEWIEPLMAAGNWVPELITIAGGEPLFAAAGQHSPWLEWQTLVDADPDFIIMMPCGYQIPQCAAETHFLSARPEWTALSAVRNDRVFMADGHHFFNRPGPRLVESAMIIAEILDPTNRSRETGTGWVRLVRSPVSA